MHSKIFKDLPAHLTYIHGTPVENHCSKGWRFSFKKIVWSTEGEKSSFIHSQLGGTYPQKVLLLYYSISFVSTLSSRKSSDAVLSHWPTFVSFNASFLCVCDHFFLSRKVKIVFSITIDFLQDFSNQFLDINKTGVNNISLMQLQRGSKSLADKCILNIEIENLETRALVKFSDRDLWEN